MHFHLIIGDSFVRRLHRYSSVKSLGVKLDSRDRVDYLVQDMFDNKSIQTIDRLTKMDFSEVGRYNDYSHLIYHIGGNDISSTTVDPTDLACKLYNSISSHLDDTGATVATIMPLTHRFGISTFRHKECKDRKTVTPSNLHEVEKSFNDRIDTFNSAVRQVVTFCSDKRIRYGKLPRLTWEPARHYCDGIHFKEPVAMNLYARAIKEQMRLGNRHSPHRRVSSF